MEGFSLDDLSHSHEGLLAFTPRLIHPARSYGVRYDRKIAAWKQRDDLPDLSDRTPSWPRRAPWHVIDCYTCRVHVLSFSMVSRSLSMDFLLVPQ